MGVTRGHLGEPLDVTEGPAASPVPLWAAGWVVSWGPGGTGTLLWEI